MAADQQNPQSNPQPNEASAPGLDLKLTRKAANRQSGFSNFWSNLRDFLNERPVKVRRGSEPSPFEQEGFGSSLSDNFKEWLRPLPRSARGAANSDLLVSSKGGFATFWQNIRDVIAPKKLPPLEVTSQPVDVPEIWSKNTQFTKVQALSLAIHVAVIVLIVLPLLPGLLAPPTQANNQPIQQINVSQYLPLLKMGNKRAGGGGGRANAAPATRGKLPTLSMHQLAPPEAKPLEHPKLMAQASVMVPNIHMPTPNLPNVGDPTTALMNDSMGNGSGSGMGGGNGSGVGSGSEYGVGGGTPMAGENGYGSPECVYCPEPQYSDAAFKLKIQGEVVLDVVIGVDGRATHIHVVKGLGYGLDEEAVNWARDICRFKPAIGPNGQQAAVRMLMDVDFHLY
ncbi:MAG TPA: energy transducer TonB [Candidatus Acidoferrales bacterium]|nr:energy transducer TonB [Candidatus Acidoferrales bacterium]